MTSTQLLYVQYLATVGTVRTVLGEFCKEPHTHTTDLITGRSNLLIDVRWAGLPAVELDSNRVLDELVVFVPLRNIIITCFWIVYVV